MDLIVNTNLIKHLAHMFDRSKPTEPMIAGMMAKPLAPLGVPELSPLPRKRPEETGISSRTVAAFLAEAEADPTLTLHGILIVRQGAVICDAVYGAYRSELYHVGHSLSKSVTATAIGLLIDEGKLSLEDKVVKVLEKRLSPLLQLTHKSLTVRHLLTMTSGSSFAEAGATVEENWLRAYFESHVRFEPGKQFSYNSMNSYVLAAIVREVSGKPMLEYLRERLFMPLGITVLHWETSPEGIEAGGWGLYLRREDVAKLGLVYLNHGLWHGKRLLSEQWVNRATTAAVSVPESYGDFDYGLHIWVGRKQNSFLFNGMFGQDMLAFRDSETIIVTNGGLEQLFQQSRYYSLLARYFAKPTVSSLPRDTAGEAILRKQLSAIAAKEAPRRWPKLLPRWFKKILGVTYCIRSNAGAIIRTETMTGTGNLSLLPFVEQVLRNRYAEGIRAMTVEKTAEAFCLRVREGEREIILPFQFDRTVRSVVRFSETDYHTAVTAALAQDEDGRGVIKLQIDFLEVASSRRLKLFYEENSMEVRMLETPGVGLMAHAINGAEEVLRTRKRMANVVSRIDPDILFYKFANTMEPTFRLWRNP